MRVLLLASAVLLLGPLVSLSCRKDDGTTPSPSGPVQPSAGPAPCAVPSVSPK